MQSNTYDDAVAIFGNDKVYLPNEEIYNLKTKTFNNGFQLFEVLSKTTEKPFSVPFVRTDINGMTKRDDNGNALWYDPTNRTHKKGRKPFETKTPVEVSNKSAGRRARRTVEQYAYANDWEWWVTLTFDPKLHPWCTDLDETTRVVYKWFNNFKQRKAPNFKRLMVFEAMTLNTPHKYHVHLFMLGVDSFMIRSKRKNKYGAIYDFEPWSDKFGFTQCISLKGKSNNERLSIAMYLSKYITKGETHEPYKKRFSASPGLSSKPRTSYEKSPLPLEAYFDDPKLEYHHKYPQRNENGAIMHVVYVFTRKDENETNPL